MVFWEFWHLTSSSYAIFLICRDPKSISKQNNIKIKKLWFKFDKKILLNKIEIDITIQSSISNNFERYFWINFKEFFKNSCSWYHHFTWPFHNKPHVVFISQFCELFLRFGLENFSRKFSRKSPCIYNKIIKNKLRIF